MVESFGLEPVTVNTLSTKETIVKKLIPELIYGYENELLEGVIGEMLKARNLTISTAESCTGGFLAHKITSVPGSSAYYWGSVIAYDNSLKIRQLGVSENTLAEHGAVSEATVREMVKGAIDLLGTDIAVATSGIAGPGGGTEEKPVGTIWIAVGNKDKIETLLVKAGKSRDKNIEYASVYALSLIRQFLLKL